MLPHEARIIGLVSQPKVMAKMVIANDERITKLELVVTLAQGLVDTHQIITMGTHETAAVRIQDIERLRTALKEVRGDNGEL